MAHRLHCQHDCDTRFEIKVLRLSKICRLVFCIESELHSHHWSLWSQCHRNNVYWLLPGTVNDNDDMANHIIYWGDWFKTTVELYRQLPHVLDTLAPYAIKPKSFDALLGSPKPHRTFVANSVVEHGLEDQFVMTYGGKWSNQEFYAKDYFIYEPGTEVIADLHLGTMDWAKYHGIQCHLSQIIPIDVFNQTAYSIIAETDYDNNLSFFSEKTVKPILAKRLFIAYSGYKFLHNLRALGFETFGSVIDESYDLMKNGTERYNAAFEQVRYLCKTPQAQILPKIRDVVEHNHQLMMSRDWTQHAADQVKNMLSEIRYDPA